jgi:hypothetical protein
MTSDRNVLFIAQQLRCGVLDTQGVPGDLGVGELMEMKQLKECSPAVGCLFWQNAMAVHLGFLSVSVLAAAF